MVPSDEVIARRLLEILQVADLGQTSVNAVREQLEAEFGVSLISKKRFLREQIDSFLESTADKREKSSTSNDDDGSEGCQTSQQENDGKSKKKTVDRHLEGDSKRFKAKLKRAMKESAPKAAKRGGFHKVCKLSPELAAVIGKEELSRPEVVRAIWSYIREHSLQDPNNKRVICPDDLLRKVLAKDRVDMFAMNKLLSKHIYTDTSSQAGNGEQAEEDNLEANPEEEKDDEPEPKAKKPKAEQKAKGSSLAASTRISPELRDFFGINEAEITRQRAIKLMWEYIKSNQLQDPSNKKMILCDTKLEQLFDCKSFSGFKDMSRLLKGHFLAVDE